MKKLNLKKNYILADIAPTILDLMKLEKPDDMNGCSLLNEINSILNFFYFNVCFHAEGKT